VVETSLGGLLTVQTRTEIAHLEPALKTAALLASPEFLHY
jgi:hypothetical protein